MIELPGQKGGYLLVAEYYPEGRKDPVISRRYLNVGNPDTGFNYYEAKP